MTLPELLSWFVIGGFAGYCLSYFIHVIYKKYKEKYKEFKAVLDATSKIKQA